MIAEHPRLFDKPWPVELLRVQVARSVASAGQRLLNEPSRTSAAQDLRSALEDLYAPAPGASAEPVAGSSARPTARAEPLALDLRRDLEALAASRAGETLCVENLRVPTLETAIEAFARRGRGRPRRGTPAGRREVALHALLAELGLVRPITQGGKESVRRADLDAAQLAATAKLIVRHVPAADDRVEIARLSRAVAEHVARIAHRKARE